MQPSRSTAGPLAGALVALAPGRAQGEASSRVDAVALFASMLDLRGSVRLAAALDARPPAPLDPLDGEAAARVAAEVKRGVADVEKAVRRMYAASATRLCSVDQVSEALSSVAVVGTSRSGRKKATGTESLAAPMEEVFARGVELVRRELRAMRAETASALQGLGPRAARLASIDAAIGEAIEKASAARIGALVPAARDAFVREIEAQIATAPEGAEPDVAAWVAPGGWMRAFIARLERATLDVLQHEAARLCAMVDAAAGCP